MKVVNTQPVHKIVKHLSKGRHFSRTSGQVVQFPATMLTLTASIISTVSKSMSEAEDLKSHAKSKYAPSQIRTKLAHKYRTPTWMHDMFKNAPHTKLNEIVIPGTHDSATDGMTKHSPYARFNKYKRVNQKMVYHWAKCQYQSVHTQLEDGIRYLDFRIEKNSSGWHTFHALLSNCFIDVLDQVGRFAAAHPYEIILLDFQHLVHFSCQEHRELMEYLIQHKTIGPRLAGSHLTAEATLGDFWNLHKNVIILYSHGHNHFSHLFWHRRTTIDSPWHNTPSISYLEPKLLNGIQERKQSKFYVSQLVLTPYLSTVIRGLFMRHSGLFYLTFPYVAQTIENGFLQVINQRARQAEKKLNIVIVDFYEHSSFVEACLDVNSENLAKDS